MIDIALDLETLGRRPGCVIASIGAAAFDTETGKVVDTFYHAINVESCVRAGLAIDADTLRWWMKQSDIARAVFNDTAAVDLRFALLEFQKFCERFPGFNLWGYGADFDNAILSFAYEAADAATPWTYKQNRCLRSLASQFPNVTVPKVGTHHNARDDAIYQANLCAAILRELHEKETA